jgi:signal transduction histidine kinase
LSIDLTIDKTGPELKIPARQLADLNVRIGRLARKVVTAQEEERTRVSRELHDEAGQALTALKLNLQTIQQNLSTNPQEARQQLELAIVLTDRTAERVRHLAHRLRPQIVDSLGLNAACAALCRQFEENSNLSIQYSGQGCEVTQEISVSLYRLLQEALTNVARHADAKHVTALLVRTSKGLRLQVDDDGCGFQSQDVTDGAGLLGMQERMEILGGSLKIHSQPGVGTRISAELPVE